MYGYWRRPNNDPTVFGQALQERALYDPTTPAVTEAYVEEATVGVGTAYADIQAYKRQKAIESGQKITAEEYKNNPELFSEGISWYEGMTVESAKIDKEFNDAARKRSQLIADASTGQDILGFAAGFAAGVFEPKNLAVGVGVSVAAPILGSAGWLGNNARRVYQMRKSASLANKIKIGVGEGVVAAAIVEPSNRYSAKQLQQDYTMADSAFNIFTSAAFGAGVPVIGNIISKAGPFMRSKIDKFGGNAMDVAATELDLAVTQLVSGQNIDVRIVEKSQPIFKKAFVSDSNLNNFMAAARELNLSKERTDFLVKYGIESNKTINSIMNSINPELLNKKKTLETEKSDALSLIQKLKESKKIQDNVDKIYLNTLDEKLQKFEKQTLPENKKRRYEKLQEFANLKERREELFNKINDFENEEIRGLRKKAQDLDFALRDIAPEFSTLTKQAESELQISKNFLALSEQERLKEIENYSKQIFSHENDSLIDYAFINEEDQRRAELPQETDATRDAELANDEAEIRMMIEQEVLNEADLKEYNAALEALNDGKARKALETLKFCLLRG